MNADEVIGFYQINDPVYEGLIRWRMGQIQKWYVDYLKGKVKQLLEVGTGNFPFSIAIGTDCMGIDFRGIEKDRNAMERAKMHVSDKFKSFEMHDMFWNSESLEFFGEGRFDLILSFEVFEHVPASDKFVENSYKALKPGGFLILETPNAEVTPLFEKVFGQLPDGAGEYEGNEHVNELSFHALFRDITDNGFNVIDFANYYLPATMWKDKDLDRYTQTMLYQYIHSAASMFPFYSYVQMFLAQKPNK